MVPGACGVAGGIGSQLVKPRLSLVLRRPLRSWQNPVRGLYSCKLTRGAGGHLPRYQDTSKQKTTTRATCRSPTDLHESIASEIKGSFTLKEKN